MNVNDVTSANEYAELIINNIIQGENNIPEIQRTPNLMLELWFKSIKEKADEVWLEYIIGKRDYFIFTEDEFIALYNKAKKDYVSELLDGMHEKGLLDVSIGEEGEFYYSLSEEGKKMAGQLKN